MKAEIEYSLSPGGQKAALAAGLSATDKQKTEIEVNNGDLELFSIRSDGSLHAEAATGGLRAWGHVWKDHKFDVPPSPADLLVFLRQRAVERERVEAAEAQVQEQARIAEAENQSQRKLRELAAIQAMRARIIAANEQGIDDGLNVTSEGVGVVGCRVAVSEYPAAAEFAARVKAQGEAEAAKKQRIEAINTAALHRAAERKTTPTADGKWQFTCPYSTLDDDWAKHVTNVNPAQKGGYALDGAWLKNNEQFALAAGEVIVVGGKEWSGSKRHGGYVREMSIYVITSSGVRSIGRWSKTEPAVGKVAELLALTPGERCQVAIEKAIALCEKNLAALYALDRTTYAEELSAEIEPRIAEWAELKQECERALLGGAGDEKITDVDSAAAAIVAAGFRALAEKHHPDKGGAQETFILLAEAKQQLVELLKLAAQGVGA